MELIRDMILSAELCTKGGFYWIPNCHALHSRADKASREISPQKSQVLRELEPRKTGELSLQKLGNFHFAFMTPVK